MKPLIVDTETSTFQKGNPYAVRNKLCYVGCFDGINYTDHSIEYNVQPHGNSISDIRARMDNSDLFVAFNSKFDLAWLRRYGIQPYKEMQLWDLQLAEFIITGQETPFLSLNGTCAHCGLGGKSDDMADKYWTKGIDTNDIPEQELRDYLKGDCEAEWTLFQWQLKYLEGKPLLKRLIWDACQDLLVTHEMEWNGLYFDLEQSKKIGDEYLEQIKALDVELNSVAGRDDIAWNSNDWLSAVLYGGTVAVDRQEAYVFTYKDGRTKNKTRWIKDGQTFNRLVEPLKGTETKKEGFFLVNEDILKKLKASGKAKEIIRLIIERNNIEKKASTYFLGWPKLHEKMDWEPNIIHGQLNHTTTKTGRLSSSKPNQQNTDKDLRKCIQTRFRKKI